MDWLILTKISLLLFLGVIASPALDASDESLQKQVEDDPWQTKLDSIIRRMNLDIDPCNDFYEFACGNYTKDSDINEGDSVMTSADWYYSNWYKHQMENDTKEDDPLAFTHLRTLYRSCNSTDPELNPGTSEFLDIIRELGGWPLLDGKSWDESSFDWMDLLYKIREYGLPNDILINFGVGVDPEDNEKNIIMIEPATPGLERKALLKGLEDRIVQAYLNYTAHVAQLFGADPTQSRIEMEEAIKFEIKVAECDSISETWNYLTVENLQEKYQQIPWKEYIRRILGSRVSFKRRRLIRVEEPQYFTCLSNVIAETPKRVIANYIFLQLSIKLDRYVDNELRQLRQDLYNSREEENNIMQERPDMCYGNNLELLAIASGALFARKYTDYAMETKTGATGIFKSIRESFRSILKQNTWMSEDTRKKALHKLNHMEALIAYPPEFFENDAIDEYYQDLKLDPSISFLRNTMNLIKFHDQKEIEKLDVAANKTSWLNYEDSVTTNAFHVGNENTIHITAALLHHDVFHANNPNYLNYGAIGSFIAHEIGHGYDNNYRIYYRKGKKRNWWDPKSDEIYKNKTQCLIDQFNSFRDKTTGKNINGTKTLPENIADLIGAKVAYYAYKNELQYEDPESMIPDIPKVDTLEKSYWLGLATASCEKLSKKELGNLIDNDEHSPGEFRVNGILSDLREFSEDFECPENSPMNPKKKCELF